MTVFRVGRTNNTLSLVKMEMWKTLKQEGKGKRINNYTYCSNKTNVDYESLMISYPYEHQLIDEIIAIMVETVMSNRAMIRILGDDYPFSVVKEKFLGIDYSHMQYILGCFDEAARSTEIKNIK